MTKKYKKMISLLIKKMQTETTTSLHTHQDGKMTRKKSKLRTDKLTEKFELLLYLHIFEGGAKGKEVRARERERENPWGDSLLNT